MSSVRYLTKTGPERDLSGSLILSPGKGGLAACAPPRHFPRQGGWPAKSPVRRAGGDWLRLCATGGPIATLQMDSAHARWPDRDRAGVVLCVKPMGLLHKRRSHK